MGHHAQYRKRFSSNTGSIYKDLPPQAGDWGVRWNGTNIQVEFTTAAPADATGLQTQFETGSTGWQTGLMGSVLNTWFAIEAGSPSGVYSVQVRWAHVTGPTQPTSDWSDAKSVTIP